MPRTYFQTRRLLPLLSALLMSAPLPAQLLRTPQNYITEGLALQQKGRYRESIERYDQALAMNASYDQAHYQKALAHYSLGEYKRAIASCDLALSQKTPMYSEEAYLLKGNAWYALRDYGKATEAYRNSLACDADNYAAHYALGRSLYKQGQTESAEEELVRALELKSTDADSHLLLAQIMKDKKEPLKSALALTNFLLLEPRGSRAEKAYGDLRLLLTGDNMGNSQGVLEQLKTDQRVVTLLGSRKSDAPEPLFVQNAEILFAALGNLPASGTDFWGNFYIGFYYDLYNAGLSEPMCYFISQSANGKSLDWLHLNSTRVEQLFDWVNEYTRKF